MTADASGKSAVVKGRLDRLLELVKLGGLKAGFRAATSDGQGAFLAAMTFFGLAAFSFHYALLPQTAREKHLQAAAGEKQESLGGERYPMLASLVSSHIKPYLCSKGASPLRDQLRQGLAAFSTEAQRIHDQAATEDSNLEPICRASTKNVGPAWTNERPARSTLFIPSTLAMRANMTCHGACEDEKAECRVDAAQALVSEFGPAIAVSRAIDILDLPKIQESGRVGVVDIETGARKVEVGGLYFVASEGLTRSIPYQAPDDFLAHYMSNGTSYVFEVLREGSEGTICNSLPEKERLPGFVTFPYLDMFGGGIVETYCAPINVDVTVQARSTVGVLCVDLQHDEASVLRSLKGAAVALDLSVVRVFKPSSREEPGWNGRVLVKPCKEFSPCPRDLITLNNWFETELFAIVYYNRELANHHTLRTGGVYVDDGGDDSKFGVSVFRGDGYWDVAIGRIRQARKRDYAALALCGICVVIALGILIQSYRRKMMRREAYLARGLAYGLLQIGMEDRIIGANDRAEAILNTPLPRLGIQSAKVLRNKTFSGFIDEKKCVLIPIRSRIDGRCIVTYDYIRRRSIAGQTTDFYASLKPSEWVRISTRIIVLPNRKEELFYAVETDVSTEQARLLTELAPPEAHRG